jgi:hypothetical protein
VREKLERVLMRKGERKGEEGKKVCETQRDRERERC